jgi:hypothetical protein
LETDNKKDKVKKKREAVIGREGQRGLFPCARNPLSPQASSKFQDLEIGTSSTEKRRISFYWFVVSTNDLFCLSKKPDK